MYPCDHVHAVAFFFFFEGLWWGTCSVYTDMSVLPPATTVIDTGNHHLDRCAFFFFYLAQGRDTCKLSFNLRGEGFHSKASGVHGGEVNSYHRPVAPTFAGRRSEYKWFLSSEDRHATVSHIPKMSFFFTIGGTAVLSETTSLRFAPSEDRISRDRASGSWENLCDLL